MLLRAPERRDATDIMVLANNPRVTRMTARIPYPYALADAEQWIGTVTDGTFGLYLKAGGNQFVGACGIAGAASPELGYWIGEPYWGRGLAGEAAGAVLKYAFETCDVPLLQAGCAVFNPASRAVLERLGFRHLGVGTIYASARRRIEPIDKFLLTADDWRRRAMP